VHGRITKQGRSQARGMLVEAAWIAARTPGPLRAFSERVRARRGKQIAAVATARKLAVLCWHLIVKGEDYAYQRPSLTTQKLRALERRAGLPARRRRGSPLHPEGGVGPRASAKRTGRARLPPARRDWQTRSPRPKAGAGAATGERL
jgi:transposase